MRVSIVKVSVSPSATDFWDIKVEEGAGYFQIRLKDEYNNTLLTQDEAQQAAERYLNKRHRGWRERSE